jgi:hypothetical protein
VRRLAVEREREVAERIGAVRGPVMHWARARRLQLVVVFGAVELASFDHLVGEREQFVWNSDAERACSF